MGWQAHLSLTLWLCFGLLPEPLSHWEKISAQSHVSLLSPLRLFSISPERVLMELFLCLNVGDGCVPPNSTPLLQAPSDLGPADSHMALHASPRDLAN